MKPKIDTSAAIAAIQAARPKMSEPATVAGTPLPMDGIERRACDAAIRRLVAEVNMATLRRVIKAGMDAGEVGSLAAQGGIARALGAEFANWRKLLEEEA